MKRNRLLLYFIFVVFFCLLSSLAQAEEIKIIFSGQAYSSLYPCQCPYEPDGGVARRATFLQSLRDQGDNLLVIEVGSIFAGGSEDSYSQNVTLDKKRTEVYLDALRIIRYDALLVSPQEYEFGEGFLGKQKDLPFVSSNIEGPFAPYVIKEIKSLRIGVVGLTGKLVKDKGAKGWVNPDKALQKAVKELKEKKVDIIVLLSSLALDEDYFLADAVKDVDIVVNGGSYLGSVHLLKRSDKIFLKTWWQARRVGVLTLTINEGIITDSSFESPRMSSEIKDHEKIVDILPKCFRDSDCLFEKGKIGKCVNPATIKAVCSYDIQPQLDLTVIKPTECRTCRSEKAIESLENIFGKLVVKELNEKDQAALELVRRLDIKMLPAYVFTKRVEDEELAPEVTRLFDVKDNLYVLKPSFSGVSYFVGRKKIPKQLDVFFDFSYKQLPEFFTMLKFFQEKHPQINVFFHFVAAKNEDGELTARRGPIEIEEFKRAACVEKLYPKKFFEYLFCRASNINSSWWDSCLDQLGLELSKVKECAMSEQGSQLFDQKIALTEELQIAFGPTIVMDNIEVISVVNVPTLEEFEGFVVGPSKEK